MIKITELTEKKFRTVHLKDELGNRTRTKEEYIGKRVVKTVSPGPRFGHFFIDLIAFQIVVVVFQTLMSILNIYVGFDSAFGLTLQLFTSISALLLWPALYFICEHSWQQTPGKLLTKTVVIDEYANKPSIRKLILRSLIRLVPFEAFSCLGDKYSRGWHDKWSDTYVVTKEELATLKELQQLEEIKRSSVNTQAF
jgi:uncharacterized RDD family membrane protein YckC